jgi:uncharacterized protein YkwD
VQHPIPHPARTVALPPKARLRGIAMLAACMAFGGGLVASGSARSQDAGSPTRCGAAPHPREVLQRLNAVRSQGAVCHRAGSLMVGSPLRWSDSLAAVATTQSRDMVTLKQMRHRDMLDRGLGERLTAAGYRFSIAVENIAVGYDSLDDVVKAWLRSEDHCDNLMNGAVLELGLACSDDATAPEPGDRRYWTLVLGSPPPSSR